MIRASRQIPDFAGVALVDILANGVAMLIIVVVVSIAARVERDERHAEQADEVAAVMSHKFSTSLVLNSLAASPPAVLHDYAASPLDQILDPETLPILELHSAFVREFYSGAIWPRRELLAEFNRMHAWLATLGDAQKKRLRIDIYDIGQFYLAISILREHGVRSTHWHFLTGSLSPGAATRCPPGVAAKDCPDETGGAAPPLPALSAAGAGRGELGDPGWPPFAAGKTQGAGSAGPAGILPGGVVPGIAGSASDRFGARSDLNAPHGAGLGAQSGGGAESAAALGSFPNADGGTASSAGGGQPQNGQNSGGAGRQVNFRIALPESVRRAAASGSAGIPALDRIFGAMLHYLGELQDTLDAGGTPSQQIAGFAERLRHAFATPPRLTAAERMIARELAVQFTLQGLVGDADTNTLALRPAPPEAGGDTLLVITPNRLLEAAAVRRGGRAGDELPEHGRISLALNAYPGLWKGLDFRLEPGSVLLMPADAHQPRQLRWRATAHVSPKLDSVTVGFVFADFDDRENLRIQADANRVRLGGRPLFSAYQEAAFGARGWLVSLYAALIGGLLLLVLAHRLLSGRTR